MAEPLLPLEAAQSGWRIPKCRSSNGMRIPEGTIDAPRTFWGPQFAGVNPKSWDESYPRTSACPASTPTGGPRVRVASRSLSGPPV